MQMYDLIQKTGRSIPLTSEEIRFLVSGFTAGQIPDYMMSAWLMAVCCRGLTPEETTELTLAMRNSGECLDLSAIGGITVDKHSTGGIGDKTTLLLAPMVAACGGYVPKMSGRGLGFTGGTIDKLESIPGFRTDLPVSVMMENTRKIGCCVIAQSGNLTPADKKIYALRNLTATVDSIPLICSSIMSKKLALGADCILLDVKYGSGAFMKTPEDALALAKTMTQVGSMAGKHCRAVITNMNTPLGEAVGNALEVEEVIAILQGTKKNQLSELAVTLSAHMLELSGKGSLAECEAMAAASIASGKALETFARMIAAQGGDASVTEHPERLPQAQECLTVHAKQDGWIAAIQSEETGLACLELGAGRTANHPDIDFGAGVRLHRTVGDAVKTGEALFTVYGRTQELCRKAADRILAGMQLSDAPAEPEQLVYAVVSA